MKCYPARWLWGLIPIAMLSWLAAHVELSAIQNDLERRSRVALAASGHDWASVAFDGRDGLLIGQPKSERQRAEAVELVRQVWGVRVVRMRAASALIADLPITPLTPVAVRPAMLHGVAPAAIAAPPPEAVPGVHVVARAMVPAAIPPAANVRAQNGEPDASTRPVHEGEDLAPVPARSSKAETGMSGAVPAGPLTVGAHLPAAGPEVGPKASLRPDVPLGPLPMAPEKPAAARPAPLPSAGSSSPATPPPNPAPRFDTAALPPGNISAPGACPSAAEAAALGLQLHFTPGAADLDKPAKVLIDGLLATLTSCPGVSLRIAGHADASGVARSNRALSQRRARAVAAYLVNKGIDASRLVALGYGDEQPVAPNDTQANRAKNRRIEVSVTARSAPLPPMPVRKQGTRNGLSHR